ncbi:glycoside hydrolase superfamily [Myxozyma melibiosi]|uniref:Glycoside hydrolase superfamily n=1 Tax=Myxozyma melibiosi TaxID=54550 RepID=A0ABR1EXX8_9ASCO
MDRIISVSLDPPLNSVSYAKSRVLEFDAFVVTTPELQELPPSFEIQIWWSTNDKEEWIASSLHLNRAREPLRLCSVASADAGVGASGKQNHIHQFSISFVPPYSASSLQFTARYRFEENTDWTWCGRIETNGVIELSRPRRNGGNAAPNLHDLFSEISTDLEASELVSEVPNSRAWKVSGLSAPSLTEPTRAALGKPIGMQRYLSLVRIQHSWMGPRHGTKDFFIDRESFMVLFQREDGYNVCVLPLSNLKNHLIFYLQSGGGKILFEVSNTASGHQTFSAFVGVSRDPMQAVQTAFYSLRSNVQTLSPYSSQLLNSAVPGESSDQSVEPTVQPIVTSGGLSRPVNGTWYEQWLDCMGFCTWNSMGIDVSHDKIMTALQSLEDAGIRVGLVIIDDGWQPTDSNRRLLAFEANEKFPNGLKFTVDSIKNKFPYVKHVAVWHALLGYWHGISPDGEIAKKYELTKGRLYNEDVYVVSGDSIKRFYDDYYGFLSSSGITVVKADVQMHIYDLEGDHIRQSDIYKQYQDALKLQSMRYFSRRIIYCMAMSPQYYYYALIQTNYTKPVLRNSDDFFPNIPSSHHWHVYCNAMNNTLTSLLHAVPDWDMFMTTVAPYSSMHAASRCFSGGPVYITDTPGFHDMEILSQIQAETTRGTSVCLRPSRQALALDPYFNLKDGRLMYLTNFYGGAGGFSLLAAFNINENDNAEFVEPIRRSMFSALATDSEYVVFSYKTGNTAEFSTSSNSSDDPALMLTQLKTNEWDIFTAAPLAVVKSQFKTTKIGAIGVLNKITGAAAIQRQQIVVPVTGRALLDIDVKVLGTLGIYISELSASGGMAAIAKLLITIQGLVMPMSSLSTQGNILKIDLDSAWRELDLQARWSNEISLRVYIT